MSPELATGIAGFVGGVGAALAGVVAGAYVQRRQDLQGRKDAAVRQVYGLLVELEVQYGLLDSAVANHGRGEAEALTEIGRVNRAVLGTARNMDLIESLDDVLLVVEASYSTKDRIKAIRALLAKLANQVSPRYVQVMRRVRVADAAILEERLRRLVEGERE